MNQPVPRTPDMPIAPAAGAATEVDAVGHVDLLTARQVAGWACGVDHGEVTVELLLNGIAIGTTPCNLERPDVGRAGYRSRSGFNYDLSGIVDASRNNLVHVRVAGRDDFLGGRSLLLKDRVRERMRQEGFDISLPLFAATAFSYEPNGASVVVTGQVKTNGEAPSAIRVTHGGRLVGVEFDKADSNSVLQAFGISVYSYSARFELDAGPCLQFEFINPDKSGSRPVCAIPGLGGLDSFAPSEESRARVTGKISSNSYITIAYTSAALFWSLAERTARKGAWLDWGCGPGRTAIPLKRVFARQWEVSGCDVDEYNIKVLQALDPDIPSTVIDLYPPMPYRARSFDVIHGISVLTHLTVENQKLWVDELARVLKPNGLALLTTHGELAVLMSGFIDHDSPIYASLVREGISDGTMDRALGPEFKDQEYYRATFQTRANARALFERCFDVVRHIPGGHHCHQDLWVLRRR